MKKIIYLIFLAVVISFTACSKDDSSTDPTNQTDPWVGTWLSTGSNVAPLLASFFSYDSVRVIMKEDQTISLATHVTGGAWTTLPGTYTVTKSTSGDVNTIDIVYAAFEQGGIVQITSGSPDQMKLEVVQTTPDIGATPRTPDTGFGSDATLGSSNIQIYVRVE